MPHVCRVSWQRVILDERERINLECLATEEYRQITANEIQTCIVTLRRNCSPDFLCEQPNSSRIPLRKFLLKKAYNNGLIAELKYETRNVNGVNRALKFEAPS